MITGDDILNMNYYKKENFTGSYRGMRYLIQKDTENEQEVFRVWLWPGPYNFKTTDDSQKTTAVFPFTPDGKQQVVDFLNEQWQNMNHS